MSTKGRWRFSLNDVPSNISIHNFILNKTDINHFITSMPNPTRENHIEVPIDFNFILLKKSVIEAINVYGIYPFEYKDKKIDTSYLSASLNWNPNATDKVSEDPNRATLGSTLGKYKSVNNYQKNENNLGRNTYNDTYSFIERTPFSRHGDLNTFLNSFNRNLIRSRISVLNGSKKDTNDISYGWHNDEQIFINLRINIPIQSTKNYAIQILSDIDSSNPTISEFPIIEGKAYAYDTHKYHRPLCKEIEPIDRINLILGVSPWFDFNHESSEWISNEYYGEVHPFTMLQEKLITPFLGKI